MFTAVCRKTFISLALELPICFLVEAIFTYEVDFASYWAFFFVFLLGGVFSTGFLGPRF